MRHHGRAQDADRDVEHLRVADDLGARQEAPEDVDDRRPREGHLDCERPRDPDDQENDDGLDVAEALRPHRHASPRGDIASCLRNLLQNRVPSCAIDIADIACPCLSGWLSPNWREIGMAIDANGQGVVKALLQKAVSSLSCWHCQRR